MTTNGNGHARQKSSRSKDKDRQPVSIDLARTTGCTAMAFTATTVYFYLPLPPEQKQVAAGSVVRPAAVCMYVMYRTICKRSCLVRKKFQDSLSHRIFGRMHEVLNIDENKN